MAAPVRRRVRSPGAVGKVHRGTNSAADRLDRRLYGRQRDLQTQLFALFAQTIKLCGECRRIRLAAANSGQSARPGNMERTERQGLRTGKILQRGRTPFRPRPIAGIEAGIDAIALEQEMVMADRTGLEQGLALLQGCLANGRDIGRTGQRAKRERAQKMPFRSRG